MKILRLNIFLLFLLTNCANENHKSKINVDQTFEPYFNTFLEEATSRGMNDLFLEDGIIIQYHFNIISKHGRMVTDTAFP